MPELESALRHAEEIVLTTTGRATGRPHRVSVWFALDDGDLLLRTDRTTDWYLNLERDPHCRVAVGALERDAHRVAIEDDAATLRRLIGLWRDKYGQEWVADWYVDRGRVPVRLRLEPG